MAWERVVIEHGIEYIYIGKDDDERLGLAKGPTVGKLEAEDWLARKRVSALEANYTVVDLSPTHFHATKLREETSTLKDREFFIREVP